MAKIEITDNTRVKFETENGGEVTCWLDDGKLMIASGWEQLLVVGQASNKIKVWEDK